jgi:RNase adaptor protein for sRNA GlmZ degradation
MCIKIIWINGAFGSGKSQTAFEINRRLDNSFVYDPENAGYFLRRNMPKELLDKDDFQNEYLWRAFNYEIIKHIAANYNGIIIIPMTIYNPQYYDEIVEKLLSDNIAIEHYILGATKETLLKRQAKRLDYNNKWLLNKIDVCIHGFEALRLKSNSTYIDTNNMNLYEVVRYIADTSKVKLKENNDNRIIRWFTRVKTQFDQIKVFG